MKKRLFALLLCILTCLTILPVAAFADGDDTFTVTIVINGRRDHVSNDVPIPSSGEYELNTEIRLPGFDDDCFYGWYEGDHVVGSVYLVDHDATLTAVFNHEFGEWVESRPATCVVEGTKKKTCTKSKCGYEVTESIPKTDHDYEYIELQEASCSETGNIAHYYCAGCEQCFNLEKTAILDPDEIIIPKSNHTWNTSLENIDDKYLKTAADCTRGAEYYRYCTLCGVSAKDADNPPEPATLLTNTPNGHQLVPVVEVPATCTKAGNISYYECSECGKKFENEDGTGELNDEQIAIPRLSADGTHQWGETGQCTRCSAKAFRLILTYNDLGTVKVNGTDVNSGAPVSLVPGEAVEITFTPNENMFLNEVAADGTAVAITNNSYTIPAAEALEDTSKTITVTFSNHIAGANVTVKFVDAAEAKNTQAAAYRSTLATETVTANDIKVLAQEIIPVWTDADGNPTDAELTPEEIEEAVPISFVMPYPDGITDSNRHDYRYYVYHLGETPTSCSISDSTADGLATSSSSFSAFASYAVPKAAQEAPSVGVRNRLNDGTLRSGALLNVSNLMEYRVGDSDTYLPITGTGTTWTGDTSTGLAAGTYHVRYKGTEEKLPSPETTAQIDDYYTVSVQVESGTGEWLAVSGSVSTFNGAPEVKKGNTLGLTFTAGDGYLVDHITEGTRVTSSRAKTSDYLVPDITESKTVKVYFRNASSIPAIDYTVSPDPIEVQPVVDDGQTLKGHIYFMTDGRQIEYIKSNTMPTNSSKWIRLEDAKLTNLTSGGKYWYRYVGQDASTAAYTQVLDYYTVTIVKKGTGKGDYRVKGYEKESDNIYLVEKGENITVTFEPANGYWLYEVDVNGTYVGQSKVQSVMTFEDIREATKIEYAFSDSSKSPKTGDNNDVTLWVTEEIVSLLGMTAITWYLFRRKET